MAALAAQVDDPGPETQAIVVRVLQYLEAAPAATEPGFSSSPAGTALKDNDISPTGGSEAAANSCPAFDAWLTGYRGRLEGFVKNCRRQ
jgi:hypothetical protein